VSVVVPAYNAEPTIDDCLRSLLELNYPPEKLELLVVDNGSRDGTADAVRRHSDRVRLLTEPTRGAGAARNTGIVRAQGEVISFTDADCVVDREWLRLLLMPLSDPAVGIAGGTILAMPGANRVERFGERIHDHRKSIEVFRPPYVITMSWASRRDVLRELGGFDEGFRRGQDVELSYRLAEAGYTVAFVPQAVVHHRNERTLPGLFREGFQHGYCSVPVRKRHDAFLRELGHRRRVDRRSYVAIAAGFRDWVRDRGEPMEAVFNSGKKAGKVAGSMRFGRLDL
jgi:glycosyltransferase involved in cell wall biosynthesis